MIKCICYGNDSWPQYDGRGTLQNIIGRFSDEDFLYGLDENSSNHFLAKLYLLRNDEKKMMEYVNKLPVRMKYEFLRILSPLDWFEW